MTADGRRRATRTTPSPWPPEPIRPTTRQHPKSPTRTDAMSKQQTRRAQREGDQRGPSQPPVATRQTPSTTTNQIHAARRRRPRPGSHSRQPQQPRRPIATRRARGRHHRPPPGPRPSSPTRSGSSDPSRAQIWSARARTLGANHPPSREHLARRRLGPRRGKDATTARTPPTNSSLRRTSHRGRAVDRCHRHDPDEPEQGNVTTRAPPCRARPRLGPCHAATKAGAAPAVDPLGTATTPPR